MIQTSNFSRAGLSTLGLVVYHLLVFAQPGIEWQNTIGGDSSDQLLSIHQTPDGGYILGGNSYSNISSDKTENDLGGEDYWIVKLNDTGNIEWQNTIGGSDDDHLHSIALTNDGGYIIAGNSKSNISGDKTENSFGDFDYWIVKLDELGETQWQKTIGGTGEDQLFSIQQTADGGFILGGFTRSFGPADYWILKLNSLGETQWQNVIGGSDEDLLISIIQTSDLGYLLSGYSYSNTSGDKTENSYGLSDMWVLKLDSLGSIEWQKDIGGTDADQLRVSWQTTDGYILGGYSKSNISGNKTISTLGGQDYWIVTLDENGDITSQKVFGGTSDDRLFSIQLTGDGGYILAGTSSSDSSGNKTENGFGDMDYWVIKLDSLENIEWQKTLGGSSDDWIFSVEQTSDNGFILGGYSFSDSSSTKTENSLGSADFWILKLGSVLGSGVNESQALQYPITIFPNPASDFLNLRISSVLRNVSLQILNSLGEVVYKNVLEGNQSRLVIDVSALPQGVYWLTMKDENGISQQKLIIQR